MARRNGSPIVLLLALAATGALIGGCRAKGEAQHTAVPAAESAGEPDELDAALAATKPRNGETPPELIAADAELEGLRGLKADSEHDFGQAVYDQILKTLSAYKRLYDREGLQWRVLAHARMGDTWSLAASKLEGEPGLQPRWDGASAKWKKKAQIDYQLAVVFAEGSGLRNAPDAQYARERWLELADEQAKDLRPQE